MIEDTIVGHLYQQKAKDDANSLRQSNMLKMLRRVDHCSSKQKASPCFPQLEESLHENTIL